VSCRAISASDHIRDRLHQVDRNIDVARPGVGIRARETLAFHLSPASAEISDSAIIGMRADINQVVPGNNQGDFPGRLACEVLAPSAL
jgi:hypothetical protein